MYMHTYMYVPISSGKTPLKPLTWCSESLSSSGFSPPEECMICHIT